MAYHKQNLKQRLGDIAWQICNQDSWQKVNMRRVAEQAGVSTTAFYRHFKDKNALKAELMLRGFMALGEGMARFSETDDFSAYGAHYVRFGLDYPHIYDLMFGNEVVDMSDFPALQAYSVGTFEGVLQGVRGMMPEHSEQEVAIKAYSVWAAVHGLVGILRRAEGAENESLRWIRDNIEDYLKMTI